MQIIQRESRKLNDNVLLKKEETKPQQAKIVEKRYFESDTGKETNVEDGKREKNTGRVLGIISQ